jgi:hypothetical protein
MLSLSHSSELVGALLVKVRSLRHARASIIPSARDTSRPPYCVKLSLSPPKQSINNPALISLRTITTILHLPRHEYLRPLSLQLHYKVHLRSLLLPIFHDGMSPQILKTGSNPAIVRRPSRGTLLRAPEWIEADAVGYYRLILLLRSKSPSLRRPSLSSYVPLSALPASAR